MSTGEPASDTFIGRLFSRIKPGSSYAAFPWKSWDKICTILETMRGRGIRLKRSQNETQWELDAISGALLDHPSAYSVYVHDPSTDINADDLPTVMRNDTATTVYCYVPCYTQDESGLNVGAGANGASMRGKVGDYVTEDWPLGFDSWGWKRLGEIDNEWWMVVGIIRPSVGIDAGMQISDISLLTENSYLKGGGSNCIAWSRDEWRVVPLAAIAKGHSVQLMCGRPWAYRQPPMPFECRIFRENEEAGLGLYIWIPPRILSAGECVIMNGEPCLRSSNGAAGTSFGWVRIAELAPGFETTRVYIQFAETSGETTDFAWGVHVVQDNGWSGGSGNDNSERASWASLYAPQIRIASVNSFYPPSSMVEFEREARNAFRQEHKGTIVASSVSVRLGGSNKVGRLKSSDGNPVINLDERSLTGDWSVGSIETSELKTGTNSLQPIRITIDGTRYLVFAKQES